MVTILSGLLQLIGLSLVLYGLFSLAPWLMFIVGGNLLFAIGLVMEPRRKSPDAT